jgi:SAM-dependent methyltransferase
MAVIHRYVAPSFAPKSVLDFGCGVARTVVSFAPLAQHVTGADVSSGMLEEARRNCAERHLDNVTLVATDDSLSALSSFDLIHSFIVFQHIPLERGRAIVRNLLTRLRPGGVGALQFSYAKRPSPAIPALAADADRGAPASAAGADSAEPPLPAVAVLDSDPEMQMNIYPMNELLALLQEFKIQRFHAEYTDHGGELGVFLFFVR